MILDVSRECILTNSIINPGIAVYEAASIETHTSYIHTFNGIALDNNHHDKILPEEMNQRVFFRDRL